MKEFNVELDNLFDIAHVDALKTMANKEDEAFLMAQREPGQCGRMGGTDLPLAHQEAMRF